MSQGYAIKPGTVTGVAAGYQTEDATEEGLRRLREQAEFTEYVEGLRGISVSERSSVPQRGVELR